MATDGESGKYGYGLRAARTLLTQHKRAYFVINGLFYGAILLGMLIALLAPDLRAKLWSDMAKTVTTGPLAPVASAYASHKFLLAVAVTFLVNLIAGSILSINIPTAIIPFSGFALIVWRGLLWGLLFLPFHHPLG